MRRIFTPTLAATGPTGRPLDPPSQPSQLERSPGAPFAAPAGALKDGAVDADLPPRMTVAQRRGR